MQASMKMEQAMEPALKTQMQLEAHEKECAIRYANIQQRLDEGSARFERLEKMMWAVYPFILACLAVAKYT